MQPVTIERKKSWLSKRFEEETLVPLSYFRGKNDNETQFHLDAKRSITVPLSMHQVFNAMEDAIAKNGPLDLTKKALPPFRKSMPIWNIPRFVKGT